MDPKLIKQEAKARVKEHGFSPYFMAFVPAILIGMLSGFISGVLGDESITGIVISFILGASYPFFVSVSFLRMSREDNFTNNQFIEDEVKPNGLRYALGGILTNLYTFLWTLLFIVPGIIKSFSYILTAFILKDDKSIGINDAIKKSREMMDGKKLQVFGMYMSYFAWVLVAGITFWITLAIFFATMISGIFLGGAVTTLAIILFILLAFSGISFLALIIKYTPRWHMAIALYYDEIK